MSKFTSAELHHLARGVEASVALDYEDNEGNNVDYLLVEGLLRLRGYIDDCILFTRGATADLVQPPIDRHILLDIESLVECATPTPWHEMQDEVDSDGLGFYRRTITRCSMTERTVVEGTDEWRVQMDTEFILRCRESVPLLLQEIRRLKAQIEFESAGRYANSNQRSDDPKAKS